MNWNTVVEFFRNSVVTPENIWLWSLKVFYIVLIFVGVRLGIYASRIIIEKIFAQKAGYKLYMEERRANTLRSIMVSVARYTLYFIGAVTALGLLGVETASIVAAAGVGGLAVGFGAQNLVRDVITGFFIIFEDQFGINDFVQVAGVSGVVEDMGLRATKIRGYTGELHIVPNGEISKVTNYNRDYTVALVEVGVSYDSNLDHVFAVLDKVCEVAQASKAAIIEKPQVVGIVNFGASDIVIRVMAKTMPAQHWEVERYLRKEIKEAFDEAKIEIPFPQTVVHHVKEI